MEDLLVGLLVFLNSLLQLNTVDLHLEELRMEVRIECKDIVILNIPALHSKACAAFRTFTGTAHQRNRVGMLTSTVLERPRSIVRKAFGLSRKLLLVQSTVPLRASQNSHQILNTP